MSVRYTELTPLEHCLHRPDTYIGGIRNTPREDWLLTTDEDQGNTEEKYVFRSFSSNQGLERLFIEAQSNAIDNAWRSLEHFTSNPEEKHTKPTLIDIEVDQKTGWTSVKNDGLVIRLEKHKESDCWNPEFIFGRLRTSSNYDDTEERKTSGKNGLGIKLTNIYSLEFCVEIVDKESGKMYTQKWKNHMKEKEEAVITKVKKVKHSYTKVSWLPDFSFFGQDGYSDDCVSLFKRFSYDTCMITGLNVSFNGTAVPAKTLKNYVKAFGCEEVLFIESKDCKVALCGNPEEVKEFRMLSFVNGCYTPDGGVHVEEWIRPLVLGLIEKLENKLKSRPNYRDIKKYFSIIVNASVVRPEFTSQTKTQLVAPRVESAITEKVISSVLKWKFVDSMLEESKSKELKELKKTEKRGYVRVEGLDSANFAGTSKSKDCVLVICEGESAKTYTVAGLDVGVFGKKGRDYIGIYPIRGKILNTRNAGMKQISDSREITGIRTALGLQLGVDYSLDENYKKLRYGKVMVVSDADSDGKHITGLILNIFHSLYPSLLQREFMFSMRTPIMTIYSRGVEKDIYSEHEGKVYLHSLSGKKFDVKWRKGLGSSKNEEVKKSFGKRIVKFLCDEKADKEMVKAFDKKYADQRKEWLAAHRDQLEDYKEEKGVEQVPISSFINHEFIDFSLEDCQRSLPHILDGLKESQRKVLYACLKKRLTTNTKVAQLAGSVAEMTQYHHGEQNLLDTIVKLAQNFVGSNNIPYLTREGQFGSRLEGGEDAAAARYIYTCLEKTTRLLFREEDDPVLTYVQSDGESVEPEYYLPVLPMVLVNGCSGIGTGWSSSIPSYNPKDLIQWIRDWLADESDGFIEMDHDELVPWYRGFTGKIELEKDAKGVSVRAVTHGNLTPLDKGKYEVNELPVGLWTNRFTERVEEMLEKKQITYRELHSTVDKVRFVLTPSEDFEVSPKTMKLFSYLPLTNMVAFDNKNQIKRYYNTDMIMREYCIKRLSLYGKRKSYQLDKLQEKSSLLSEKIRFLQLVMSEELEIFRKSEEWIQQELKKRKFEERDNSYEYLIGMPIRSFSQTQIDKLTREKAELDSCITELKSTDPKDIWLKELKEVEKEVCV
jgi:DNA topoisomerase-2